MEFHPEITWQGAQPEFDLVPLGDERRSTGSHYTPPELVAPLIQHTLEPVLAERLKSAPANGKEAAILSIKVCDPACGSGHFLLAAARRLGKELARVRTGEDEPAPERVHESIRDVMAHCIFGVDKNPLAIELCRVALWLESHAGGKPLTFLDHHIRCGDSLVGVADLSVLKAGIPDEAFKPVENQDHALTSSLKRQNSAEREGQGGLFAWNLESELQHLAGANGEVDAIRDDTPELVRHKRDQYQRRFTDPAWLRQKEVCDLWTAAFFQPIQQGQPLITTATVRARLRDQAVSPRVTAQAVVYADKEHFFHWALEFPEIFERGGFDVILGNPPFMGGLHISTEYGGHYRRWLEIAYKPYGGTADLCTTFFRRAFYLLNPSGFFGMIATNTIGQGDTRESGLAILLNDQGNITFARRFVKWPGKATVEVNLVVVGKGKTPKQSYLDGQKVEFISSRLDNESESDPQSIEGNEGKSFQGSVVLGMGFVLTHDEARSLLSKNSQNNECLYQYLTGEDLNSDFRQRPSRWVINFFQWRMDQAKNYPDLFSIVEAKVKPERELLRDEISTQAKRKKYWWHYGAPATQLYQAISDFDRVLARSRVSELHMLAFVPKTYVFSDATVVFIFDDNYHFALLQCGIHEVWLRKQASSLRTDIRYTPTDCFATFPFPQVEYNANNLSALLQIPTFSEADRLGGEYYEHRKQVMLARQLGLTKMYNLYNNPERIDEDIRRLRELHAAMDNAILACYSWQDMDLGHGFHQNDRGQTRFTVAPEAKSILLRRLLALNLEIAEGERRPASARVELCQAVPQPVQASSQPARSSAPGAFAPAPTRKARAESPAQAETSKLQMALGLPASAPQPPKAKTAPVDTTLYRCSVCRAFVIGSNRETHAKDKHKGQRVDYEAAGKR